MMGILSITGAIVLLAMVLFVAAEILLRVYRWVEETFFVEKVHRKDFLPTSYHVYIDWLEDWSKPMFRYLPIGFRLFNNDHPLSPVKTNAIGFRCDELADPVDGERRIVILGGSAAWGSGASSNETTIAGHLERIANADRRLLIHHDRVKCYNFAQVNGRQTQDILNLIFFAAKIRPEIVISFNGFNEINSPRFMNRDYLRKYGVFYIYEMEGWEPLEAGTNKRKLMMDAIRMWGRQNVELFRRFNFGGKVTGAAAGGGVNDAFDADCIALGSELFVRHLALMERLTKSFNFRHFQFMQPHIYRKKHLSAPEQKIVDLYDHYRPVQGGKETGDYLRNQNIYQQILSQCKADPSMPPVLDLSDMFRETDQTIFNTLVHLNDIGYQMVAERIYETLVAPTVGADRPEG